MLNRQKDIPIGTEVRTVNSAIHARVLRHITDSTGREFTVVLDLTGSQAGYRKRKVRTFNVFPTFNN